jgi:hypothetical protein
MRQQYGAIVNAQVFLTGGVHEAEATMIAAIDAYLIGHGGRMGMSQ